MILAQKGSKFLRWIVRAGCALALASGVATAATQVERAAFFSAAYATPECSVAALSPDGKLLAAVYRTPEGVSVRFIDLALAEVKTSVGLGHAASGSALSDQVFWIGGGRVLVQINRRDIVALDVSGKNLTKVVDWQDGMWYDDPVTGLGRAIQRQVRVVALPADEPDFTYVEAAWAGRYSVIKVHLGSGKAEQVWDGTSDGEPIYDERGRARVRRVNADKRDGYEWRDADGKPPRWVPLEQAVSAVGVAEWGITAANLHGPRSIPLGFGRDPDRLYFGSNVGRDTLGVYELDLKSGRRTEFAVEHPSFDLAWHSAYGGGNSLRWDRRSGKLVGVQYMGEQFGTVWVDKELSEVQRRIEALVPGNGVLIEGWDDARGRFLVRLTNRIDLGSFAVFDRAQGKMRRYITCAPALAGLPRVYATAWSLKRPDGTVLRGSLALPAEPRSKPTPVIVLMRHGLWGGVPVGYAADVRVLAQMGYAVLEVSHRGILGLGLRHWQAGRGQMETVIAEDVVAALEGIAPQAGLKQDKVALWGSLFGGTAALRLAKIMPERVACVVVEGPLLDLHASYEDGQRVSGNTRYMETAHREFFGPTDAKFRAWSPVGFAAELKQPVIFAAIESRYPRTGDVRLEVIKTMQAAGNPPVVVKESAGEDLDVSHATARIAAAAEEFLVKHFPRSKP